MSKISVDANFKYLQEKDICPSVLFYIKAYSFFDQESGRRYIYKNNLKSKTIEGATYNVNRYQVSQTLKKLKADEYLLEDIDEDGRIRYAVNQPNGQSYVMIDDEFFKQLLRNKDKHTICAYVYLFRKYKYAQQMNDMSKARFTYKDLLSVVFGKDYWGGTEYYFMQDIMNSLEEDGLIEYNVLRIPRTDGYSDTEYTFIRQLVKVNECFKEKGDTEDIKFCGKEKIYYGEEMRTLDEIRDILQGDTSMWDKCVNIDKNQYVLSKYAGVKEYALGK